MSPTQAVRESATQLRRLYTRYLNLPQADLQAGELVVVKTVIERLLQILPSPVSSQGRTLLTQQPDLTWDQSIQYLEAILLGHHAANTGQTQQPTRSAQPDDPCKIRGHMGHTNKECKIQARFKQGHQTGAPQQGNATGSA